MSINSSDLLFRTESYQIINCALEVHNALGCGLLEKPYENALCVELRQRNIPFLQQPRYNVFYKGYVVGEYVPDLVIFNQIIVDTKTVEVISNIEKAQMLNYLKITKLRLGIIINFKHPKLQNERVVL